MKTFLVGGAVRDELLGFPVTERDWVVVGETPESLMEQGFKRVGKGFPVFLHPQTREEYALARTERKTAPGYHGFSIHASPGVTLEEDLTRRDLTINAIARGLDGKLIDPCQGRQDLELRLLRHISEAFSEDPVRVLRVARFAARYAHIGFTVADETMELMASMVKSGEVDALVSERVWAEFVRALGERTPASFIAVLRTCGALERLFPEFDRLFDVPLSTRADAKVDASAGQQSIRVLENAVQASGCVLVRFAALVSGLGAGMEEASGLAELEAYCERLKVPGDFKKLATRVILYQESCTNIFILSAEKIFAILKKLDALRKEAGLGPFLLACKAVEQGKMRHDVDYPQGDFLLNCQRVVQVVDVQAILRQGLSGREVGTELERRRVRAVREFIDGSPGAGKTRTGGKSS
jgi:tRNA nucleotidyltransferase (CCA-adding enzyme)